MARKFPRRKNYNPMVKLLRHYTEIKRLYGNIESSVLSKDSFTVIMNITPSENSQTYRVKISYRYGYKPRAVLLSPDLQQKEGKYPHHIYEMDKNGHARLCVYCPFLDEWNEDMSIATSFIPWVSTWLNTYEYWLITGEWHYDEIVGHGDLSKEGV